MAKNRQADKGKQGSTPTKKQLQAKIHALEAKEVDNG